MYSILQTAAKADINTVNVVVKHVPDFSASREKNDLGYLTFDLKVDLEPLFNWNVKQLFLYLSAEYSTPKNKVNVIKRVLSESVSGNMRCILLSEKGEPSGAVGQDHPARGERGA